MNAARTGLSKRGRDGLSTGTLKHLPAVPEWSDLDDHHGKIAFASDRRYLFD